MGPPQAGHCSDLTSGELEDWITAEDGNTFFKIVLVPVSDVSVFYLDTFDLSDWGEGAVVIPRVVSFLNTNTVHVQPRLQPAEL